MKVHYRSLYKVTALGLTRRPESVWILARSFGEAVSRWEARCRELLVAWRAMQPEGTEFVEPIIGEPDSVELICQSDELDLGEESNAAEATGGAS